MTGSHDLPPAIVPLPDPMVSGFVEVMMAHPLPSGAADYERVARSLVVILSEMMAPQSADVCQKMQDDFARELRAAIRDARMPKMRVVE